MAETDTKKPSTKNPFLEMISIKKWKPDPETMDSVDQTLKRATPGGDAEPDQWSKDYTKSR